MVRWNFALAVIVSIASMTLYYNDAHAAFRSGGFGGFRSSGSYSRPSTTFGRSLSVRPMPSLPKARSVPSFPKASARPTITPRPTIQPSPRVAPQTANLYRVRPLFHTTPRYTYHDYYYHAPVYSSGPSFWDIWFWSYMMGNHQTVVQQAAIPHCGDGLYLDKNNTCQKLPVCGANQRLTKDMICEVIPNEPKKAEAVPPSGDRAQPNWEKAIEFNP